MRLLTILGRWFTRPLLCAVIVGLAVLAFLTWWTRPAPSWQVAGEWQPVCFNARGTKLLCTYGGGDRFGVRAVFDTATGNVLEEFAYCKNYELWFFGPNDQVMGVEKDVVLGGHCELRLIAVATGRVQGKYRPQGFIPVKSWSPYVDVYAYVPLAASPDGRYIVIGNFMNAYGATPTPRELRIWNVANGEVGPAIPGAADPDAQITFSPDSSIFAVYGFVRQQRATQARRYQTSDGKALEQPLLLPNNPNGFIFELRCGSDGKWRAIRHRNGPPFGIDIIDLETVGNPSLWIKPSEHESFSLYYHHGGEWLYFQSTQSQTTPSWWQSLRAWFGYKQEDAVYSEQLRIVDVKSGQDLYSREAVPNQKFHPLAALDGRHLAIGVFGSSGSGLEWWDLERSRPWRWIMVVTLVSAVLAWVWRRRQARPTPE